MRAGLNIEIRDSAFDPDIVGRQVEVQNPEADQPLYRVHIYLEGPDLVRVRSVTYKLHETFRNPVRRVIRSPTNPRCKLSFWAWGVFAVEAEIKDKRGRPHRRHHRLAYNRDIFQEDVEFKVR